MLVARRNSIFGRDRQDRIGRQAPPTAALPGIAADPTRAAEKICGSFDAVSTQDLAAHRQDAGAFGNATFKAARDRGHRGDEEIHLTPIEFRLLAVLLNNAGKVLTQRQLLNQVWGPNAVEHSHYLRIYMGHLRQKLEQDPARPRHFLTETGIGYRFMP